MRVQLLIFNNEPNLARRVLRDLSMSHRNHTPSIHYVTEARNLSPQKHGPLEACRMIQEGKTRLRNPAIKMFGSIHLREEFDIQKH